MTYGWNDTEARTRRERAEAAAEAARPVTLREKLGDTVIPRTVGDPGDPESHSVTRMLGQVFHDELADAEAHYGRRLLADERELLEEFVGREGS